MPRLRKEVILTKMPDEIQPFKLSDLYDHVGIALTLDELPDLDPLTLEMSAATLVHTPTGDLMSNSRSV